MTADRPEHELLRLSITRRFTPPTDASIPGLLDRVEDWTYLLELARRQHVLPLLQDCLSTNGRRAGPQAVFWTLAQAVAMIQARNRQLARELVRLHRAAADAHIRLLSFKGPVLAAAYYGDIGLRQFGDLDVLVDRASSDRAEELFAGLGYRRARDFGFEVSLINARRRIAVDLHRAVSADNFPIALEFDGLWERREKVELGHGCAETLSTPDVVLVIGVEAARNARQGKAKLGKMSDLVHVLRAVTDTEWAQIEREARRLDVRRVLWFASELASSLLRMPAPRQVDLDRFRGAREFVGRDRDFTLVRLHPGAARLGPLRQRDARAREELGVGVDELPALRAAEPRGEVAQVRARAGAEVDDREWLLWERL